MPTAAKVKQVEQIKERYERASGVIFTEYRGLSVPALQKLRRNLAAQGAEYSVVKNTLFKRAAGDDAEKFPEAMTSGPTAVAFVYKDEMATTKALFDFIKEQKAFVVKGGYLEGKLYDGAQMEALSKLPPKDVLLAQLIGVIAAPLSNLVGTIQEIYAAPIRAIGAVADKAAENAPAKPSPAEPSSAEASPSGQPVVDDQSEMAASAEPSPGGQPVVDDQAEVATSAEPSPSSQEVVDDQATTERQPDDAPPESEPTAEAPAEATTETTEETN